MPRRSNLYDTKLTWLISGAEKQRQSEEAEAARESLAKFGEFVLGKPPARHHREWIDALVTEVSSDCLHRVAGENLEILAPRGSAKSTWIAIFVAWTIGHNPNAPIIYLGYTESVALSRSRIVKRIIESSKYREVFPHIRPGRRWSDTDWEIDKEYAGITDLDYDYTFYAAGILGSITSRRSALIVYDDLIKSSDSIATIEAREKITQNIGEVLQPTLIPGGRQIDIGTRFRADDVHSTEFTEENGWKVLVQSAIVEDEHGNEQSYWPERFTLQFLQELREAKPAIFSFQYQNVIIRISEISIDPDWIQKTDNLPTHFDTYVIGADLSSSEREKADYTVFVLAGRNADDSNYYLLDMRRGRWSGNVSKLNVLLEMLSEWGIVDMEEDEEGERRWFSGPQTCYLMAEAVSYQGSLQGDFKDYVSGRLGISNIVYRKPATHGDKLNRLRGVSGLFENGVVKFNKSVNFARAIKELVNFGATDHDDCVDAIIYALRGISSRRALSASED